MRASFRASRPLPRRVRLWCARARRLVFGDGQQSLVARLLTLLLIGAAVTYVAVNIGLWVTSTRLIVDSLEKQAVQWVAEFDQLGVPLYVSRNASAPTRIDAQLRKLPDIVLLRYYDAGGTKVIGEYGPGRPQAIPVMTAVQLAALRALPAGSGKQVIEHALFGDTRMRVFAPIVTRSMRADSLLNLRIGAEADETSRVVGYLEMNIGLDQYREQLLAGIVRGSLVIAVLLIGVLLIARRVIRRALQPLTNLQEPLVRLAQGDIDVTVASGGDREIAAISNALNATIKAIRERDEALRRVAERDALTGLVNRASFMRELDLEIAHIAAGAPTSAVFFVDLDQFKYVNDSYGHAAGDRLLIKVADLLRSRMRDSDVVARFGGDEFTILARNVDQQRAADIAASLNEVMREALVVEGEHSFTINCSIGITLVSSDRFGVEEIISQSDMACYEAKSRGRNRYQAYEFGAEDRKKIMSDMSWAQQIKAALREDRFQLAYQPIQCVTLRAGDYYEVLLRMQGQDGRLVSPGAFLPIAQRFGLLVDIDRWVIRHALRTLGEIRRAGRAMVFSINLSGQTLDDPDLYEIIRDAMHNNALPHGAVVFEITEQTAVRNIDKAGQLINRLSALGCAFALDDFGKGFSSFAHLKHLPVSYIKIDGSFVENLMANPVDQTMVASIIQIARALGKQTIAEFVQNEETVTLLREAGVDYVQGYHIGKPADLPDDESKRAAG